MKRRFWLACVLVTALFCAAPAKAQTNVIVRTTNLPALQALCAVPATCTLVRGLDGTLGQLFLVTSPLPLQNLLGLLQPVLGFVSAEVDQILNLGGGLNVVSLPLDPTLMSDRTPVPYPAGSSTTALYSYVNQPASGVVEVQTAQSQFNVTGTGIVADIDTGVDPNHPVLQPVLLLGYDFTRNQPGGSEMNDLPPSFPPPTCTATCPAPAQVNQSSVAILDQSSVAILDSSQYSAFGHGTMVMGVIHLVAPTVQLLPLKTFKSDGTANLSDILRAIYYAAQNSANVINMSFDTKTQSTELSNALNYASELGVICAASAGNDGMQETVYPAALQSVVMGVGSVGSTSTTDGMRSSFSNYGSAVVWVAAPGEQIVTTYPFNTYAAGWGTSFSAPFVSGGAALLRNLNSTINETQAAAAVANAAPLDPTLGLNHGRLDLVPALQSLSGGSGTPDYSVSGAPSSQTITAGQTASYTVSATPVHGFNQTVTWSCTGAPAGAVCTVSPSSVTLDGTHTATATVRLTTTARGLTPWLVLPPSVPQIHLWVMVTSCLAWVAVLLMVWRFRNTSQQPRGLAAAAGVLTFSMYMYSCAAAGYTNGNPPAPVTLSSVALNPGSVTGGSPSSGMVTLSGAAVSAGAVVNLSSNNASATVPASVTVAAGYTSATFSVNTTAVTTSTPATISASYGGATKTATLTVAPQGTGTPAGTYTLTITGSSGNLSHSTMVQVTAN